MNVAKVNSPSVSAWKRGMESAELSHLKENDTIRLALTIAVFDRFKKVFFCTTTEKLVLTKPNYVTDFSLRP